MNKTLHLIDYKDITPLSKHSFVIRYYFTLIEDSKINTPEEENETEKIFIDVEISWTKAATWNLMDESAYPNVVKILFEYGKREIIEKIKDSTIEKGNTLHIYTNTHPELVCPFNPNKISINKGQKFKISIPDETLNQRLQGEKIAFSIITKRDEINALFKNKYKEKLFIVTQERNLLELFRSAESIEEFSYRITALGNLVGSLNKDMLLKATKLDSGIGSIKLLQSLLNNISTDQRITEIFKNLILLRKAYPVHGDNVEGVIEAHKFFGLVYPIKNFDESWNKIKNEYYNALNELFVIAETFEI